MLSIIFILLTTIFLAYTNGANDNFKGVATLFGSGTADYKKALWWATITTFLGSLAALFLSTKLVTAFSGKGLVPDAIASDPHFLISVGMGAALAVFMATVTGIPVSTTHSLLGAMVGAGLLSTGQVNFHILGNKFFLPLILSPTMAVLLTLVIYPSFKLARVKLGILQQMCLCVGENVEPVCIQAGAGAAVLKSTGIVLTVDQLKNCQHYYYGKILGFDSQNILDKLHYFSAGAVSFARGLNDTPKIVALLLVMRAFSFPDERIIPFGIPLLREKAGIFIVAAAMAIGGLLNSRKVALTMSKRITKMNHGQGFSANLVTAFLVIFASKWGMPVSTTHVSCGSLFGIGMVNRKADRSLIRQVISAWILTLPLACILSGICLLILRLF